MHFTVNLTIYALFFPGRGYITFSLFRIRTPGVPVYESSFQLPRQGPEQLPSGHSLQRTTNYEYASSAAALFRHMFQALDAVLPPQ